MKGNNVSKLRDAYELIKDKSRWTKGHSAVDENGDLTLVKQAVRWCAVGALSYYEAGVEDNVLIDVLAAKMFHLRDIIQVNDELGHEAVMQVFEKAIIEREGSL